MILSLLSFPLPPSALCTIFGKRRLPCPVTPLVFPSPPVQFPLGSPYSFRLGGRRGNLSAGGGGDLAHLPPLPPRPNHPPTQSQKKFPLGKNEILHRAKIERPILGTQTDLCPHTLPYPLPTATRSPWRGVLPVAHGSPSPPRQGHRQGRCRARVLTLSGRPDGCVSPGPLPLRSPTPQQRSTARRVLGASSARRIFFFLASVDLAQDFSAHLPPVPPIFPHLW